MLKVIAIGDVHADFGKLWDALRASFTADADGNPTAPVLDGRFQVILIGDLVHPKNLDGYARLTGIKTFSHRDPEHLKAASRAEAEELYKLKRYVENAGGNVTVILGNHDSAALDHKYDLGTASGLTHREFNPKKGGEELPEDLQAWMRSWPMHVRLSGIHFSHAGPLPGMASYDDFFYGDPDTKNWWQTKPHYVHDAGHRFGVYGHTVMPEGIYVDPEQRFVMIDALEKRQYLEVLIRDDEDFDYRIAAF
jgi:Calcineurin-like phosphoesterase